MSTRLDSCGLNRSRGLDWDNAARRITFGAASFPAGVDSVQSGSPERALCVRPAAEVDRVTPVSDLD